jgi:group I intron endonuclease
MYPKELINAPCENVSSLNELGNKPFSIGAYIFNMDKKVGIYKITNPKNKIYIGQSGDIHNRFLDYKQLNCKNQIKLYNSFLKYGVDKHRFDIVCICDKCDLNTYEKYYISLYQTTNKKTGLNLKEGGSHGSWSDEVKEKIGNYHRGKVMSEESKLKMSIAKRNMSPETKKKMSDAKKAAGTIPPSRKGIPHTKETLIQIQKTKHIKRLNNQDYGKWRKKKQDALAQSI